MFVDQPDIPVPLAVEFPFPAWATRPSRGRPRRGASGQPVSAADPFAVVGSAPASDDDDPVLTGEAIG